MGNEQPNKVGRASKMQIEVACLKAKFHLELMRDRRNAEIIKGQKELVAKIKGKSRNKAEEILIAQRIVNGLKYTAACNQLIADAISIKTQSAFVSENINNSQKLQPWLTTIYNLLFGADRLGISSLNQVKAVLAALNNPLQVTMLTPSPTPQELNIYMLEMSQRNQISLQTINMVGHKFTKDTQKIPSINPREFSQLEIQIAQTFKHQFQKQQHHNQGNPYDNQAFNQHPNHNNPYNQGFNPQPHNQGFNPQPPNQGFNNQLPNQGFNNNIEPSKQERSTPQYLKKNQLPTNINPYKGFSNIQPVQIYIPPKIQPSKTKDEKQFDKEIDLKKEQDFYPNIGLGQRLPSYHPQKHQPEIQKKQDNNIAKSPTISQILRDFDK